MKLDHTNIFKHVSEGNKVYYASFNGVMLGTPATSFNDKEEPEHWLIVGTSMALPVLPEHPNQNYAFSQPGYFTTHEEAVEYFRSLLVNFIRKSNSHELKSNPIRMDELDNFIAWAKESSYPEDFETMRDEYRTQMSIIVPKKT